MTQKLRPVADPLRDALHKAIASRDAAKEALTRATAAEHAGLDLLAEAEKELQRFGDLDDQIVQHRAKLVKDTAKGGPSADLSLPTELVERRAARDEAREHVAANKVAHASLTREFEAAQKALQRAEHSVSETAGAILREEANKQAAALRAAWSTVWQLTDTLEALRASPISVALPADAVGLLQVIESFDHRQFAGSRNGGLAEAIGRWRAWHEALRDDPDAPKPEFSDDGASAVERVA